MTPVFILISAIYKKIGAWETAIAQYKSTLKIKPDYVEALRNKGNALQDFACFTGIASISNAKAAFFKKPTKQNAKPFIIIDDKNMML